MIVLKDQKKIITKNRSRITFNNKNGKKVVLYGAKNDGAGPEPILPDTDFTNEPYYTIYYTPDSPTTFVEKNGNYLDNIVKTETGKVILVFKTDFDRSNIMIFGNVTGSVGGVLTSRAILSIHTVADFLNYTSNNIYVCTTDIGLYYANVPFKIVFVNAGGF